MALTCRHFWGDWKHIHPLGTRPRTPWRRLTRVPWVRCALSFLVRHLVGKSSATLGVCHCHRGRAWGFGASRLGGVAAHAPKHRFTLEPLLRRQRLGRRAPGNKSRQRQRAEKSCGFGHLFVPVKDNLRLTLKGLGPLRLDSNQPCHAQPCQGFVLAPGRVSRARCSLRAPYDQIGNLGSDGLPACERRAITSRTTGRFAFPRAPGPDALRRRRKWTIRIALVAALEQFAAGPALTRQPAEDHTDSKQLAAYSLTRKLACSRWRS